MRPQVRYECAGKSDESTTFRYSWESIMNGNVFVFRPGGIPVQNVFTDWPLLISSMSGVEGREILEFDDSIVTPCQIPAGQWPMS